MPIELSCGQCGGRLLVEALGVVVACPHCGVHLSKELQDVHVDTQPTSSLVYPFVGRIISTWKTTTGGERIWIYYKFDGTRWIPPWGRRGSIGFIDELIENEAMKNVDEKLRYPWANPADHIKIWISK